MPSAVLANAVEAQLPQPTQQDQGFEPWQPAQPAAWRRTDVHTQNSLTADSENALPSSAQQRLTGQWQQRVVEDHMQGFPSAMLELSSWAHSLNPDVQQVPAASAGEEKQYVNPSCIGSQPAVSQQPAHTSGLRQQAAQNLTSTIKRVPDWQTMYGLLEVRYLSSASTYARSAGQCAGIAGAK